MGIRRGFFKCWRSMLFRPFLPARCRRSTLFKLFLPARCRRSMLQDTRSSTSPYKSIMKKFLPLLLVIALTACSDDDPSTNNTSSNNTNNSNTSDMASNNTTADMGTEDTGSMDDMDAVDMAGDDMGQPTGTALTGFKRIEIGGDHEMEKARSQRRPLRSRDWMSRSRSRRVMDTHARCSWTERSSAGA